MKLPNAVKLVAGNVVVLAGILAAVNLASLIVIEGYLFAKGVVGPSEAELPDGWWSLPMYVDKDASRALFEDFHSIEYHYVPFLEWSRSPFRGRGTTIGEEGDRIHEDPPWDGESQGVVRFFGGSTMWGTGAPDQGTIPALFHELNPQYTVSQDAPMDLVVFYEGVNEITNCQVGEEGPTHAQVTGFRRMTDTPLVPDNSWDHLRALGWSLLLARTHELGVAVKSRLSSEAGIEPSETPRWDCDTNPEKVEAAATILLRNWEMAQAIAASRGARFVGLLQPVAHFGSPNLEVVQPILRADLRANYAVLYPALLERLRSAGHEWIYDVSGAFDGVGPVLIDDFHVTEDGNRVIAERLNTILSADSDSVGNPGVPGRPAR